jgi:hypothetical protein
MPHGSYSPGDAATKLNMIRLTCQKCHRAGQYRVDRLIESTALISSCPIFVTSSPTVLGRMI